MRITLDSNVFTDDFRMQNTHFELLKHFLRIMPETELFICRIVIDDVLNQFKERLMFETTRSVRGTLNINNLTGYSFQTERNKFVEEEAERFREVFLDKLKNINISIIQYKDIEHSQVVKRCFERSKFFRNTQFKHIFSWEAVLQQVLKPEEYVVAITDQARQLIISEEPVLFDSDVYECRTHNRFIKHQIPDLPEWRRMELFPTLYNFLQKHLTPLLQLRHDKLDLLNDSADGNQYSSYLEQWIGNNRQTLVIELERQLGDIFYPLGINTHNYSLHVHAIDTRPTRITHHDIYHLDENTLYWPTRVKLYISMSFDADAEALISVKNLDSSETRLMAQYSSDWLCHIFSKIELPIHISFIWDMQKKTTTHQQIIFLPIERLCKNCGETLDTLTEHICPTCQTLWS